MTFTNLRLRLGVLLAVVALGCGTDSVLTGGLEPPSAVRAAALSVNSIQVSWTIPSGVDIANTNFEVQRRIDLKGRFETIATVSASAGTDFLDTGLQPETFYGYRLLSLNKLGDASGPSTVAGALTPPPPGIQIQTVLGVGTTVGIADPNGYQIHISGGIDTVVRIGAVETKRFSPLEVGTYTLTLSDVLPTCTIAGDTTRTVTITDLGIATEQKVIFNATCLDPTLGEVVAVVNVSGDSLDPDGFRLDYAGIIPGDTIPVLGGGALPNTGGALTFPRLRPGDYEVTLSNVGGPCAITGPASRNVTTTPQVADTVTFQVTCPNKSGGSGPFVWRNTFTPQSAANGQTVTLDVTVDLTAVPTQDFGVAQGIVAYNPAVLQYVSAQAPPGSGLTNLTVNASTPGSITFGNFTTGTPPKGLIGVARFTFQVKSATGTSATATQLQIAAAGDGFTALDTLFRVVEDTFTVGAGSGNQSPTAQAGGPYSGAAGASISLSSSGSSDADGSIVSYAWTFGDGGTSTVANPTHTYAAAGSFTATLTVTDNQGATGTDQATVTVTGGGGGGNLSPAAVAGGPYSAQAGSAISFSSAGSNDPDGSIASYSWDFGDGGSSTLANPGHIYAAAGSFTATLTVTDNLGATGTAQATVTVTPASSTPFAWTSSFGGLESGLNTYPLTITLNLAQDISQTSGPEALGSFAVDSLTWDPAVLQYFSLSFGSGGGSFNTTDAVGGCKCKLIFSGAPSVGSNSGVVAIATVRFRPAAGAVSGASTTTKTGLGPVLSTAALGSFNYSSLISVVEGTLTLP
jgi:PKD repeat protein